MKFSIPYNGDNAFFEKLVDSGLVSHVEEIYFPGNPLIIQSGRRPKIKDFLVEDGGKVFFDGERYDDALNILIQDANQLGIRLNLLLNYFGSLSSEQMEYVSSLKEVGVSAVTVGNIELLGQVNELWGKEIEIQNSVYIEARSYEHIKNLIDKGVSILLLPPEMNDNLRKIEKVQEIIGQYESVKLKIMVNEGCIKYCPHRKNDQINAQSYKIEPTIFDIKNNTENNRYLSQSCRIHMNNKGIHKTNFINPNDIHKYHKFNPILKVVGRSFDTERIFTIIRSYLFEFYEGDLRSIIENFKHSQSPILTGNSRAKTNFLIGEEGA